MKVKDILPKKEKLKREFECFQKLELLFRNNKELAEEIADKANSSLPLYNLMTEARMLYADSIEEIDKLINEAEISL